MFNMTSQIEDNSSANDEELRCTLYMCIESYLHKLLTSQIILALFPPCLLEGNITDFGCV
jgi:hypothetical protein